MNIPRQMIEAGARASWGVQWPEIPWDKLDDLVKQDVLDGTEAAIRAAIGCAEVVDIQADWSIKQWTSGVTIAAKPGDTILIVRAEKGGGNG